MHSSKTIIRASAFMPLLIIGGISLLLTIAFIKLGHLPQYGNDKDPCTIFSNGFIKFIDFSLIASVYFLIISLFTIVFSLFARINGVNRKEKFFAIGIYTLGLLILILLKQTEAFVWLVD